MVNLLFIAINAFYQHNTCNIEKSIIAYKENSKNHRIKFK